MSKTSIRQAGLTEERLSEVQREHILCEQLRSIQAELTGLDVRWLADVCSTDIDTPKARPIAPGAPI